MSLRLLVSAMPGETRAAWLEDGRLTDLVIRRDARPELLGSLYLGRITKVDKGLEAGFVDIGLDEPGFLPAGETPHGLFQEGAAVTVKVLREPGGGKGARLTARIKDPPAGLDGVARGQKPPALLASGDDAMARVLSGAAAPDEILVDDAEAFAAMKSRLADARPELLERLRLDTGAGSLFEREQVEEQIDDLLRPRVALPSGGVLLVEPVSSLTAIDVDSGRHDGRGGKARQAREVNLEAAAEIPRQLRLRALSGLIVIDFLAMKQAADRKEVVAALRRGLRHDPEPHRVNPMAASGLVEMTRRRGRAALHEILTEPCGLGGGGRRKSAVTLAYEALRQLRSEAATRRGAAPVIEAAPRLVAALEGPVAPARQALEARLGRPVRLIADSAVEDPPFNVVLEQESRVRSNRSDS